MMWVLVLAIFASVLYVASPTISEAGHESTAIAEDMYNQLKNQDKVEEVIPPPAHVGEYVVVYLDQMKIELKDGTTTLETLPIITQGKPGSYYETIGGEYIHDYKIETHFSSIGHVYMPWSIHVFGNFFIHGIPYYPNGTKVSSTYSGGCIRLSDNDAKKVYDFVKRGTPIIITRHGEDAFLPSKQTPALEQKMDMTRLMVAMISLEVLTQDTSITGLSGEKTSRRKILPELIVNNNDKVIRLYVQALGEETYLDYMNRKAQALGLANTVFTSTHDPAITTNGDYEKFLDYIDTYKTYLNTVRGISTIATTTP